MDPELAQKLTQLPRAVLGRDPPWARNGCYPCMVAVRLHASAVAVCTRIPLPSPSLSGNLTLIPCQPPCVLHQRYPKASRRRYIQSGVIILLLVWELLFAILFYVYNPGTPPNQAQR